MTIHISDSFRQVIVNHLTGNLLVESTLTPLILGIFGPPGEGKTFQTETILSELSMAAQIVSPGELESENAGHPAQMLRGLYQSASQDAKRGTPTVLVVNDVDTVLGDWGSRVQYTVNRQVVIGQLMAFCDYPNLVAGTATRRVPIIVTGNNPTTLYGPMMRPGRMRIFAWEPGLEDKVAAVKGLFPALPEVSIAALIRVRPSHSIAFWADVKAALWEQRVGDWLTEQPEAQVRSMLARGEKASLEPTAVSEEQISRIADHLDRGETRQRDFLNA